MTRSLYEDTNGDPRGQRGARCLKPSGLLSGESLASPLWVNSVTLKELWQSFPLQ